MLSLVKKKLRLSIKALHTSGGSGHRPVVDIGGASTEMIIGEGFSAM